MVYLPVLDCILQAMALNAIPFIRVTGWTLAYLDRDQPAVIVLLADTIERRSRPAGRDQTLLSLALLDIVGQWLRLGAMKACGWPAVRHDV